MSNVRIVVPLALSEGQPIQYRTHTGKTVSATVRDPKPRIMVHGMIHFELRTPNGLKLIPQQWIERVQR